MNRFNKSFYNKKLYSQIKSILKPPAIFNKMNNKNKIKIYQKIRNLSILKDYTDLFKDEIDTHKFSEIYPELYSKIRYEFERVIPRTDSQIMINKLKKSVEIIQKFLENKGYDIRNINIVGNIDINKIVVIILESALSSTKNRDNLQDKIKNKNSKRFEIANGEIITYEFHAKLQKNIILYLANLILKNNPQMSEALVSVFDSLEYIRRDTNQYDIDALCYQLEELFINYVCENKTRLLHYTPTNSIIKKYKLVALPDELLNSYINSKHVPEIIVPDVDYLNGAEQIDSSRKIKKGSSRISLSTKTNKILKISQSKKYLVDDSAVNLFKKLDGIDQDIDALPFTPIIVLERMENELVNLGKQISDKDKNDIVKIMSEMKKSKIRVDCLLTHIKEKIDIPEESIKIILKRHKLKRDFDKRVSLRKLHSTIIKMAELFEGYPVYFIESFDYRLRMYTRSYMFSRISGLYKYIICDFVKYNLTKRGITVMLESLFANKPILIEEIGKDIYQDRLELLKWGKEEAKKMSDEEILQNDSESFYRLLLKEEIIKLDSNNPRTNFMIEIDQRNSVAVIFAIIMKSHKMGRLVNLTSKDNGDIANYLKDKSSRYFNGLISDDSISLMKNNRTIHKKLLMCFLYNQQFIGRLNEIDGFDLGISEDDKKTIAKLYPDFLEVEISGMTLKKKYLNDVIEFYLIHALNQEIKVNTLDESSVFWYIFKDITSKDKKYRERPVYKSPVTDSNMSYARKKSIVEKPNKMKLISSFLPNLIHSIDAAIIRLIILRIYEKCKYSCTHLHDSLRFKPNEYDNVIKSIVEIYTEINTENLLDDLLFENLKYNLNKDHHQELNRLINRFNNYGKESFSINKENFNARHMFRHIS